VTTNVRDGEEFHSDITFNIGEKNDVILCMEELAANGYIIPSYAFEYKLYTRETQT
jgi:hypothetical protein